MDASGCGEQSVPWGAEPFDIHNSIHPAVVPFLQLRMALHCPFHGPILPDREASTFPDVARAHLPQAKLAQLIASRHGRLSVSGQQTWHTS